MIVYIALMALLWISFDIVFCMNYYFMDDLSDSFFTEISFADVFLKVSQISTKTFKNVFGSLYDNYIMLLKVI
jgi:hypothetical protein